MAVDWRLLNPTGGFDYLETLQATGHASQQEQANRQRLQQRQLQQQVGSQVRNGDYAGAQSAALQGGDLDLARSIYGLQGDQRKKLAQEAGVMAAAAAKLRGVPIEQRQAELNRLAPTLQDFGFDPQELAAADLSDAGLAGYVEWGHKMLEGTDRQDEPSVIRTLRAIGVDPQSNEGRDIVTRSLAAPRYLPNGDGTFTVMGGGAPGAQPQFAPSPNGPAASAAPPPEAIQALQAGHGTPAQFDEIFGQGAAARVMGGAPSQGGATFP